MKKKVFIDGEAGTTGLKIYERLGQRADISLLSLPSDQRKDTAARRAALNEADVAFLCLPDAAAIEAVSLIDNPDTIVIDTSTAHRTDGAWVYAFPELSSVFAQRLKNAKRIAVPGCHASGFIALVFPLIEAGLLPQDAALTCFSLTGYSGGGKKMIAEYAAADRNPLLTAPRQYAVGQTHKHLPEMQAVTGLTKAPLFCPVVADFYSGMEVTVPLFLAQLVPGKDANDIKEVYAAKYRGPIVCSSDGDEAGFLSAGAFSGLDIMQIGVFGNDERILLTARYDNLGKGASGAAVEALNYVLGVDPAEGLLLE